MMQVFPVENRSRGSRRDLIPSALHYTLGRKKDYSTAAMILMKLKDSELMKEKGCRKFNKKVRGNKKEPR